MAEPHLCSSPNAATQAGPEFQPYVQFLSWTVLVTDRPYNARLKNSS